MRPTTSINGYRCGPTTMAHRKKPTMVETGIRLNAALGIDCIALPGNGGQVGMTSCPGKKDRGYSGTVGAGELDADLEVICAWRADAVITLLEPIEIEMLGMPMLPSLLFCRGIEWYHLPIRDLDVPDRLFEGCWMESGARLREILSEGGRVLVHCRRGLGRTGLVAAKLLVEFGFKPSHAISLIRRVRPGCIETPAQERYVLALKRWPVLRPGGEDRVARPAPDKALCPACRDLPGARCQEPASWALRI